jgi:hypothetical protein
MTELKQIDIYDTIIGKIVETYDDNFKNIRTYQENDNIYFMANDVLTFLNKRVDGGLGRYFKNFNKKELFIKIVPVNKKTADIYISVDIKCNVLTKYGLIRCISICGKDTKAGIALREFIYLMFDHIEQTKIDLYVEHISAMESVEIQEELKQVDKDLSGGIVYFIKDSHTGYIKIGRTNGDIATRLSQLQVGNPSELTLCKTIECDSRVMEKKLHIHFAARHIRGEWFNISDEEI